MEILPRIPPGFVWPIFIIQHMPGTFTPSFAERLDKNCAIPFKEIEDGDSLEAGKGYLAPGDIHSTLVATEKSGIKTLRFRTKKLPADTVHTPSIDVAMESVAAAIEPQQIIAILLTGMGSDGAAMMARIRQLGGRTIAESEETAVVFGMPKEAIKLGGAEFVLPSYEIGEKIVTLAQSNSNKSRTKDLSFPKKFPLHVTI
jgi:two-component system chemotaxis response regulator CheB